MKKYIIVATTLIMCLSSYLHATSMSPTFSIRYEDFINSASPSAAIGLKFDMGDGKHTGFEVNADGSDTRLLLGWKWGVIGVGSISDDGTPAGTLHAHYTFGVGIKVLEGLSTNLEYCMTPTAPADAANVNTANRLRLSMSVMF